MGESVKINYQDILLPEELLNSFAKAMTPEIRKFYSSKEGQGYYQKWLVRHPEYAAEKVDATAPGLSA